LLSTAIVKVRDTNGDFHEARALVDVATQEHFITKPLCKFLNLKKNLHKNLPISGIGRSHNNITRITDLVFKSASGEYSEKNVAWAWSRAPIAAGNVRTCTGVNKEGSGHTLER
jgi:hypothetical protein